MQINRKVFEEWYKKVYWNFEDGKVYFNQETNSYNHFDVDLAWNAWQASRSYIHESV